MSVFKKFWPKPDPVENKPLPEQPIEPYYSSSESVPCQYGHAIKGRIPGKLELENDGKICDCGSIKFYIDLCGCEKNKHFELYEKQA